VTYKAQIPTLGRKYTNLTWTWTKAPVPVFLQTFAFNTLIPMIEDDLQFLISTEEITLGFKIITTSLAVKQNAL